jgi:hypothetical protein
MRSFFKLFLILSCCCFGKTVFAVSDLFVVQGNNFPYYIAQLTDSNGTPLDLMGATVTFTMIPSSNPSTPIIYKQPATVVDSTNGMVEYVWVDGNTNTIGAYKIRFTVTKDGRVFSKPTTEIARVVIIY